VDELPRLGGEPAPPKDALGAEEGVQRRPHQIGARDRDADRVEAVAHPFEQLDDVRLPECLVVQPVIDLCDQA
jgi:hypothetical protein